MQKTFSPPRRTIARKVWAPEGRRDVKEITPKIGTDIYMNNVTPSFQTLKNSQKRPQLSKSIEPSKYRGTIKYYVLKQLKNEKI